jgi:hypothetical protein
LKASFIQEDSGVVTEVTERVGAESGGESPKRFEIDGTAPERGEKAHAPQRLEARARARTWVEDLLERLLKRRAQGGGDQKKECLILTNKAVMSLKPNDLVYEQSRTNPFKEEAQAWFVAPPRGLAGSPRLVVSQPAAHSGLYAGEPEGVAAPQPTSSPLVISFDDGQISGLSFGDGSIDGMGGQRKSRGKLGATSQLRR